MILDHVPKGPRFLVIGGTCTQPYRLTDRDLNVIDELMVPDRLKNAVGKPEDHDVLHSFLPQIMVDPVNLGFVKHLANRGIDRLG